MPRSRRFRKNQNRVKPEWGKNNPQTKAKNRKMLMIAGILVIAVIAISAFVVLNPGLFLVPQQVRLRLLVPLPLRLLLL